MEVCVFDIQRFSVHDGPGIRSTVFLKGCPLSCLWCCNPESQKWHPEVLLNADLCIGCNRCVTACPTGAVVNNQGQLSYNRQICTDCGSCVETCYADARTIKGAMMNVDQMVDAIIKDRAFYDNSGGGVTFSGGEPLMHAAFLEEVMKRCVEQGIHISVETCGHVPMANIERIAPYVSLFLFDIKHTDSEKHKAFTGVDNAQILANCRRLAELGREISIRVPVIPTFNMDEPTLSSIAQFAHEIGAKNMHLLPYHRFASNKYNMLGRTYWHPGVEKAEVEDVEVLRDAIAIPGLKIMIGG